MTKTKKNKYFESYTETYCDPLDREMMAFIVKDNSIWREGFSIYSITPSMSQDDILGTDFKIEFRRYGQLPHIPRKVYNISHVCQKGKTQDFAT